MIGFGLFSVFALGLRHGADPDHLAAIDNMTRTALSERPGISKFVGTLFASGHSVMVLAIAALVGLLGSRFSHYHDEIEMVGTVISILVLLLIAYMNIRQLADGATDRLVGIKTRFVPQALRRSANPLAAVAVGLLFGFGFETSSQIATYAVAFGSGSGMGGAIAVGAMFCLGMIVTDTLDSVLVHRLVGAQNMPGRSLRNPVRVWIGAVTFMAVGVALYELAQVLGWQSPISDLTVSGILILGLVCTFSYVFIATRRFSPGQLASEKIV